MIRAPLHSQRAIDQLQKDLAASRASETRLQHDVQQVSNHQHRSFCRCRIIRVTRVCLASSTLLLPRSDLLSLRHSLTRHLASAHAIQDLFAAAQVAQQHGAALQDLRAQLSASRAEASACASALAAATADRGAAVVRITFLDLWPHEPTSRIHHLCIAICARRDGNVLQLQARAAELAALAETQAAVAGVDAARRSPPRRRAPPQPPKPWRPARSAQSSARCTGSISQWAHCLSAAAAP